MVPTTFTHSLRCYIRPSLTPQQLLDRIAEVGIESAPDLIQEGYGELNFVFIRELDDHWQITAKAKNILDARSEITQGSLLTNGFNLGREASLQVQFRF